MVIYDINGNSIFNGTGGETTIDNSLLYNYTRWNGKSLVTEGNSLTAHNKWGNYLAEFLGMTHTNVAMSGSAITTNPQTKGTTMEDIVANVNDNYPANVDLVILQGDTNVVMDGEPSDQMDGDNPKTTWTARMNYMIRCLRAKYHNVVIVLMPDSVRYDGEVEAYEYERNRSGRDAMKELAEYNRLAFFNVDCCTPFNPKYDDNYYTRTGDPEDSHTAQAHGQDWIHPSPYSYTRSKGRALAEFVAGLVFDPNAPNTASEGWDKTYTITYELGASVKSSNMTTSKEAYTTYKTTLTGATNVSITMGGNDITANAYTTNNGNVKIIGITGDIVITAN